MEFKGCNEKGVHVSPHVITTDMSLKGEKVLVTRNIRQIGLDLLENEGIEVIQWKSDDAIPRNELIEKVKGVSGLYCMLTDCVDKDILDSAGPNLRVVSTMSVGFDHIDLEECAKRGIAVGNTGLVSQDAVAEHAVALLLAVSRRIVEAMQQIAEGGWGTWKPQWLCGHTLTGSTMGIIGLGKIGYLTAKRLKGFDVKEFLYTDLYQSPHAEKIPATKVELDDLLTRSDFIVICCALNDSTKGLMGRANFKKMKSTAIFVNISRGPIVNEDDLLEALNSGEIRGAGLDVTHPEPMAKDNPLLPHPNCVVTPHIGSATIQAREQMASGAARNMIAGLKNQTMESQVKTLRKV